MHTVAIPISMNLLLLFVEGEGNLIVRLQTFYDVWKTTLNSIRSVVCTNPWTALTFTLHCIVLITMLSVQIVCQGIPSGKETHEWHCNYSAVDGGQWTPLL